MNLRPLMTLATLLALTVGITYLLVYEDITPLPQAIDNVHNNVDRLRDINYVSSERESNFAAFGLDDGQIKRTIRKLGDLEAEHGSRIAPLLRDASDPLEITDDLCGKISERRPRYYALPYLLEVDGTRRRPIRMRSVSMLEKGEWAAASPIGEIYRTAEIRDEPQQDTTLMAVAAVMTRNEQALLQNERPWRVGSMSGWSWDDVKEKYSYIDEFVVDYFALMHLVVEIAQSEEGICGG
ncbi:MAG: hypothetical protein AAFV53_08610 [Myxococcota bacterium]